jgi:hypothetical protein
VASLLLYMKRIASHLKADIEAHVETSAHVESASRAFWAFRIHALMITREGMETALMISTALFQMRSAPVSLGLMLDRRSGRHRVRLTRLGRGVDIKALLNILAVFLSISWFSSSSTAFTSCRGARSSRPLRSSTTRWILGPTARSGTCSLTRWPSPTAWLLVSWWKRRNDPGITAQAAQRGITEP